MERIRILVRRVRTFVVVAAMLGATLLAPVAVPVAVIVRWIRRDDRRIEHVVSAPNVALLRRRDPVAGDLR